MISENTPIRTRIWHESRGMGIILGKYDKDPNTFLVDFPAERVYIHRKHLTEIEGEKS